MNGYRLKGGEPSIKAMTPFHQSYGFSLEVDITFSKRLLASVVVQMAAHLAYSNALLR